MDKERDKMDVDTAIKLMVHLNPLTALINYASFITFLAIGVLAYRSRSIADGVMYFLGLIFVRICLINLLQWRAKRNFASLSQTQNFESTGAREK
jgi:hypothetical protein